MIARIVVSLQDMFNESAMSQKIISDFFLKPAPPDPAKRPRQTPEPCVPATGQQQAAERPAGPHPPSPVLPGASQEAISFKPPQDYNFPARKFSGENFSRSCKAAWFREWQWLEYIAVSDGIVCGVCRSAVKSKLVGSDTDSLFLKDRVISVAASERSFSALRRLKTWLRNTMKQERLTHLAIMNAHSDLIDECDVSALLGEFISRSTERRSTFGKV